MMRNSSWYVIFADPDNGISYSKTAANKDSEKYYIAEGGR